MLYLRICAQSQYLVCTSYTYFILEMTYLLLSTSFRPGTCFLWCVFGPCFTTDGRRIWRTNAMENTEDMRDMLETTVFNHLLDGPLGGGEQSRDAALALIRRPSSVECKPNYIEVCSVQSLEMAMAPTAGLTTEQRNADYVPLLPGDLRRARRRRKTLVS